MPLLDLTEKNLNKNIFKLSIPVAIENLLHMSVFIIDAVMVGRLGTDALAAVGLSGALSFTISMVFSSLNVGSASIIARHIGAKERDQAQIVGAQAIFMALVMGILATPFLILFAEKMLILMSAEPQVSALGKSYLQIVGGFFVFRMIILACNGILRGAGDTKTPMKATLVINCINILFNWLLIFGVGPFPKWGVAGAAWATAIAYTIGTVLLCTKLFTGRCVLHISIRQIIHVHFESLKRIVRISAPAAIDAFLTQMGFLFLPRL